MDRVAVFGTVDLGSNPSGHTIYARLFKSIPFSFKNLEASSSRSIPTNLGFSASPSIKERLGSYKPSSGKSFPVASSTFGSYKVPSACTKPA